MEVQFSERFEHSFSKLTKSERKSVRKAISLLSDNPKHPGLHVKKMEGRDLWEARASSRLRMTFEMAEGVITLRHVGEHDKTLKNP